MLFLTCERSFPLLCFEAVHLGKEALKHKDHTNEFCKLFVHVLNCLLAQHFIFSFNVLNIDLFSLPHISQQRTLEDITHTQSKRISCFLFFKRAMKLQSTDTGLFVVVFLKNT